MYLLKDFFAYLYDSMVEYDLLVFALIEISSSNKFTRKILLIDEVGLFKNSTLMSCTENNMFFYIRVNYLT